jgi:hypothetical protein
MSGTHQFLILFFISRIITNHTLSVVNIGWSVTHLSISTIRTIMLEGDDCIYEYSDIYNYENAPNERSTRREQRARLE